MLSIKKWILGNSTFIVLIFILIAIAWVIAFSIQHWQELQASIQVYKEDNLIVRSLVNNTLILALSRIFFIFIIAFGSIILIAFSIKIFSASALKLWGIEIKSETEGFKTDLKQKNEIINKLENENRRLNDLIDEIYQQTNILLNITGTEGE